MDVVSNGGEDFRRLAAKFKAAGADGAAIRKKLTATIQGHLKTITAEQQAAVMAMTVRSVSGRGTARRQAFHEARGLRGRRVRQQVGGHGLRAAVRRSIKSKVSYTGRRLGARITVDPSGLPPSQRRLPKHLDNPRGWRHPVWGHRDRRWATQVGEPYFTRPIARHRERVRRSVTADVNEVLRTLT